MLLTIDVSLKKALRLLTAFGMMGLAGTVVLAGEMLPPARWISGGTDVPESPAPILYRSFNLEMLPSRAMFNVAVAGWCEVRVNGEKVGRDVLSPVTCQPDVRISSIEMDVTSFLRIGANTIEIVLGNGWYNAFTKSSWKFSEAPWVSCPKIKGELMVNGSRLMATDGSRQCCDSAIVFNALRNGEWYDARMEGRRLNKRPAKVEKYSPWGQVNAETAVPCHEGEVFQPKRVLFDPQGRYVYDFGANIAGWCEIEVEASEGQTRLVD